MLLLTLILGVFLYFFVASHMYVVPCKGICCIILEKLEATAAQALEEDKGKQTKGILSGKRTHYTQTKNVF